MSFDAPARSGKAIEIPKIGFVAALDVECASLRRQSTRAGTWLVVQSGPGPARAAAAAARAVEAGASVLVSWGLAGGLDLRLAPGTVVAPRRVLAQGAEPVAVDAGCHAAIAAVAGDVALELGDLLSVPSPLESPAAKSAAAAATGAVAVDMESAAIAAAAARARVPFVALRVVVDAADDALPPGVDRWIDERGHRRLVATLRAVVDLRQWRPLLELARRYRVASAVLERLALMLAAGGPFAADAPARNARS